MIPLEIPLSSSVVGEGETTVINAFTHLVAEKPLVLATMGNQLYLYVALTQLLVFGTFSACGSHVESVSGFALGIWGNWAALLAVARRGTGDATLPKAAACVVKYPIA